VISANQQKPLSISKGTFVIINCRDHDDQERDTNQPRQKTGLDEKRTNYFKTLILEIFMLPFFYIQPHISYKLPHILCNVHFHVWNILQRRLHKVLRKFCKPLLPYRFQGSLVVQTHNKVWNIPCQVECILPSFLFPFPACMMKRNDCKQSHILNMPRYRIDKCDNLSLFLFF
jgi:hypothetical protein